MITSSIGFSCFVQKCNKQVNKLLRKHYGINKLRLPQNNPVKYKEPVPS